MKKNLKIVRIILLFLLVVWLVFVAIDCIRLKNSDSRTKPLITLKIQDYENGYKYMGLGYSIKYYTIANTAGYRTEINLFEIIPVWSIEAQ